jgi:photosystem II stability/assembly factor-like uncharacterized protein
VVPTAPVDGGGNLVSYAIVSPQTIVATDGSRLDITTDGGRTWRAGQPGASLSGVTEVDFVSASDGWALVKGRLLRTTDGGASWLTPTPSARG